MSAAPVLVKAKRFSLEFLSGTKKGEKLYLNQEKIKIGRNNDNDIILDNDPKVSRTHAEIRYSSDEFVVKNVSSKNILLVNGQITSETKLKSNDIILIGNTEFLFINETDNKLKEKAPVNLKMVAPIGQVNPVSLSSNFPTTNQSPPSGVSIQANHMSGVHQTPPKAIPSYQNSQIDDSKKTMIYGIIGIVVLVGAFIISNQVRKTKNIKLRTSDEIEIDLDKSKSTVTGIEEKIKNSGKNDPSYEIAQQHYLKGFRDYQQGQYGRAIQSLQAALSFYPNHVLAKRYAILARKKLDEVISYSIKNGKKYKEQGNFRMCIASFNSVLMMVIESESSNYLEAKQYKMECEYLQRQLIN